jgi:hypothetical protein
VFLGRKNCQKIREQGALVELGQQQSVAGDFEVHGTLIYLVFPT